MWKEMARIIGEVGPRYVLVENSPILTSRGLGVVLADLASLGYNAQWGVLGAGHIGAWHLRERIWLVASNDRKERISWNKPRSIPWQQGVPWCKDVRRLEDLLNRPDIPEPFVRGVRNGVASYVDRIGAIGNGQVPAVVKLAWETLNP
jgi:DNA (cytosine-5)-methyltransferase 1